MTIRTMMRAARARAHPDTPLTIFPGRLGALGGSVSVEQGPGLTRYDGRRRPTACLVPAMPGAWGRHVRAHEAGHARIRPIKLGEERHNATAQALEDIRVDYIHRPDSEQLRRDMLTTALMGRHVLGSGPGAALLALDVIPHPALVEPWQSAMRMALMTGLVIDFAEPQTAARMRRAVPLLGEWQRAAPAPYYGDPASLAGMSRGALFRRIRYHAARLRRSHTKKRTTRRLKDIRVLIDLLDAFFTPRVRVPADDRPVGDDHKRGPRADVEWEPADGHCRVEMLPLTASTVSDTARRDRQSRATSSGAHVSTRRLVRAMLTGGSSRVFRRRVRRPTPATSIMIDASGSMQLRPETLRAALAEIPAASIAYYCGATERSGCIYVYADGGRRFAGNTLPKEGGGNAVDYEALEFLRAQDAAVRYFVSDLGFTGPRSGEAHRLFDRLRDSGEIVHCETIEELMDSIRAQVRRDDNPPRR